ncbi:MAG: hypothetical protein EOO81_01115 [Oxalobacteraceae bacterium]|nr:MAG: hypothetical protein EOO81_01115 [Oxalobacteraceae bacterium]
MKTSQSPLVARVALGVPAVIGLSIPFALCVMSYRSTDLLIHTAQVTVGSVVTKRCQNHGEVVYSYDVNGKSYTGRGSAGVCINASCDGTKTGDRVQVMYSSQKPQISSCMPSGSNLEARIQAEKRDIITNFVTPVVMSFAIFFGIFEMTRIDYGKDKKPSGGEN